MRPGRAGSPLGQSRWPAGQSGPLCASSVQLRALTASVASRKAECLLPASEALVLIDARVAAPGAGQLPGWSAGWMPLGDGELRSVHRSAPKQRSLLATSVASRPRDNPTLGVGVSVPFGAGHVLVLRTGRGLCSRGTGAGQISPNTGQPKRDTLGRPRWTIWRCSPCHPRRSVAACREIRAGVLCARCRP